jgi:hypothetical protein
MFYILMLILLVFRVHGTVDHPDFVDQNQF